MPAPHISRLQKFVDNYFRDRSSYRVLEAGCGSMSFLDLSDKTTIVDIDISEQQLARNKILNERICGDIMPMIFQ
jgi:hypothetical protein